jgi:hypothetical protein
MTLRDETRITLSAEHVSAELDGEAVVLNLKDGVYFGLNPVGSRIWSLLKEAPKSVAELRQAVLAEYDVGYEECDRDLRALLDALREHGLIDINA